MSENFSTVEISNALEPLSVEETRKVFFQLRVPLKTLDDIAAQYNGDMQKAYLVQAWLDMNPNASWDKLVTALKKINKNSLAADIESKYITRAPVPRNGSPSLPSTSFVSAAPQLDTPDLLDPTSPAPATTNLSSAPSQVAPISPSLPFATPPRAPVPTSDPRVDDVKETIEYLEKEYSDIKYEARKSLTVKENQEPQFVDRFRDHLLDLPVTKKRVHIRFFSRSEDEIFTAKTIQKLFTILGRYCNYSNYEIIFHIVKRFCDELKGRMHKYHDSLVHFEKSTTVDIYLCAISARPGGEISEGFIRMTVKINKPPSECTLHEIREFKESVEEKASIESYAMYIESPGEGSVIVGLIVPREVGWMVGVVFTADFKQEHLLTDITMDGSCSTDYLVTLAL